jgi:hypothetical protein
MAVISFSDKPEQIWCVAGWAFRQVLDDVLAEFPDEPDMRTKFDQSKEISGLIVERLPPQLGERVTHAIRHVVEGVLAGRIRSGILDKPYGNAETIEQYHEALRQLLGSIPSQREPHR